ncbi:hypothetical protein LIER_36110 [Lithospermum erythrorhizon]|uniref:Uncharacterized protein n=1 Tax=Lithospermum erythrorhizon TaxID=34254 RepID=A0AAV3P5V8_LITER
MALANIIRRAASRVIPSAEPKDISPSPEGLLHPLFCRSTTYPRRFHDVAALLKCHLQINGVIRMSILQINNENLRHNNWRLYVSLVNSPRF